MNAFLPEQKSNNACNYSNGEEKTFASLCPMLRASAFTVICFGKAAPHGILATTGDTSFAYRPFDGFKGRDTYPLKLCAEKADGHKGCSTLTYQVDVR